MSLVVVLAVSNKKFTPDPSYCLRFILLMAEHRDGGNGEKLLRREIPSVFFFLGTSRKIGTMLLFYVLAILKGFVSLNSNIINENILINLLSSEI